ncbi:MAG: hypothetical protein A2161_15830 [Candidatus Schekmanbacteria bacterium RBG_13_48_7]|uniref:Endonuclease/exonuclease/phosphatase domain-containing protein n=1 Tax=Candidatus Schekmanbacteria bacterium RBG_13_48_7 TaxID=1817878 RepID=A0A1F7RPM4_9BACT|nr:MAG: hypothetical protein A2161_15830 [Candidatus Schekmanbacteria bacterium RBG_13_48_7]
MRKLILINFILAVSLVILPQPLFAQKQSQCDDVANRGHINVLTINLLFSELQERNTRLQRIADFAEQQYRSGEPVDLILLQEVIGGPLAGTINASTDLKNMLARKRLGYNLRYRIANGVPGLATVGNAILSRCEVLFSLAQDLPFVSEEVFQDVSITLKRKVIMIYIKVPHYGRLSVYDTHLCAYCNPDDRFIQTEVLLDFVNSVENFVPGANPVILGGDFNSNVKVPEELPVYNLVTTGNGFIDTYAVFNGCFDCCNPPDISGCTYAIPGNPFAFDLFTGLPGDTVRIDYIFSRDLGSVLNSVVVFNTAPDWVSDHSGVLTSINLR